MKTIEIISEDSDKTTNEVIEWITSKPSCIRRRNVQNSTSCTILFSNKTTEINLGDKKKNKTYWIRRGKVQILPKDIRNSNYVSYLMKEGFPILIFLEMHLKKNNVLLGSYMEESLNNKILNLNLAREVGFKIPRTIITNKKKELLKFYSKNAPVISKCFVSDPIINSKTHFYITPGTYIVKEKEIEVLADTIAPSLVQKYIDKKYEVRVFVTGFSYFAMAIFSQIDKKTKIDFRNYNEAKPNRNVPFQLPDQVKDKITLFLKRKQMNQGSLDFIVTSENEFFFLEINPQGQLDWLSKNCNYYIEKHIADQLTTQKINII